MHADTTLHFDITSGIAGDMSLAVLHGLGLDLSEVADIISQITGKNITIKVEHTFINGIKTARLNIDIPHEHAHRTLGDIRGLIAGANLPEVVVTDALGIFSLVADAEGEVHGKPAEEVHFHEVGALDSILDIVGFAYGVYRLGITDITSSKPVLGSGFVKCAHGKVPVPAPATLKILEGSEVIRTDEPNELTTPTGAAILKYYVKDFSTSYEGKILGSAYSTGTITLKTMSNLLRGTLLSKGTKADKIMVIDTSIDDCTGEVIGGLFGSLMPHCLDMYTTPATGKKNRPAIVLTVMCESEKLQTVAKLIFSHTTTAGLRYRKTDRLIMGRMIKKVEVDGHSVRIKVLTYEEIVKYAPEWDDCVSVADKTGMSPMAVYDRAKSLAD
jgi:uncharacterized protein (TIGR00299 family) protein